MQTVILVGGRGKRLSPITDRVPKPMVLIKDKPFLEHLLLLLKRNALKRVLLCVGYLADQIEDYFGDGRELDMEIKYSREKEPLGTGGALKLAEDLIEDKFLLLYGDSYLDIDYAGFIRFFESKKSTGSIAIYDNVRCDTKVKNNIAMDGDLIIRYDKFNEDASLKYVEAGVSIFRKQVLGLIEANRSVSLENDIFPILIRNNELRGYEVKARFCDIGTPEGLEYFKEKI